MESTIVSRPSPFLQPGSRTKQGSLALLYIRRDQSIPTILSELDEANEGYSEGKVTNTRFGSFPHSTLIDLPWGSQVRASNVDTGSRGRPGLKRKRDDEAGTAPPDPPTPVPESSGTTRAPKAATKAQTGFIHVLPPTPEIWTSSLPHRTQVVYTPDYSLILQGLRARPGTQLIEAGAGSGSFSHAAARAVYNGYPPALGDSNHSHDTRKGKVWSFEFHSQRVEKLRSEIRSHGLEGIIELNHRDVYSDGFAVMGSDGKQAVQASAVFLDLPAPWLALPHLSRSLAQRTGENSLALAKEVPVAEPREEVPGTNAYGDRGSNDGRDNEGNEKEELNTPMTDGTVPVTPASLSGPLCTTLPVRICCFLPCIEQVQRTVSALESYAWQEVSVVEVAAKRIEIRRERVGMNEEGLRGGVTAPMNVDEAVVKLREAEERTKTFHLIGKGPRPGQKKGENATAETLGIKKKHERLEESREVNSRRKIYKEGRLVHRAEPELKTHTSYLIFAVLPRDWTEEDEKEAREKWGTGAADEPAPERKSKKQAKREARIAKKGAKKSKDRFVRAKDLADSESDGVPDQTDIDSQSEDNDRGTATTAPGIDDGPTSRVSLHRAGPANQGGEGDNMIL